MRAIIFVKVLPKKFFDRPTLRVAKELLGKFLVRKIPPKPPFAKGGFIVGMITEVEAYVGPKDKASHASRGKTERTKVMFGKPGNWYVYLIYGMYCCLNIVTEKEGYPAAILIRSVEIEADLRGLKRGFTRKSPLSPLYKRGKLGDFTNVRHGVSNIAGPGRVCKFFKIDKRFNEKSASRRTGLWIAAHPPGERASRHERGSPAAAPQNVWAGRHKVNPRQIRRGKRIGIDYAGKWKDQPWRFWIS